MKKRIFFFMMLLLFGASPAYAVNIDTRHRPSLSAPVDSSEFGAFLYAYKGLAMAINGIFIITAIICLLINITKLSASAGNDIARRKALQGIAYSGLALAIFGGAGTLIGMFWYAFS